MDSRKIIIAGSIAAVLIGLIVFGILLFRRANLEPPIEPLTVPVESPAATTTPPTPNGNSPPAVLPPPVGNVPPDETPDYSGLPDTDGDGLLDPQEADNGTDPNKADTDGDSYGDYEELFAGTDPNDPADHPDHHQPPKSAPMPLP